MSTLPPAPAADATTTPLMRQYAVAKRQNPDALLFFRMGDFYELFFEDAQVASRELQITLTARDKERSVPMCGVPYHAADNYLSRLLRKEYRVAICEQMEDPELTKKIVRREVTRVLTPGTAVDPALASGRNNDLAALHIAGSVSALALLDLSTGDFRASEFSGPGSIGFCLDELIPPIMFHPHARTVTSSVVTGPELITGSERGGGSGLWGSNHGDESYDRAFLGGLGQLVPEASGAS